MVFYVQPPRGHLSLSQLETMCHKRLGFLLAVWRCGGRAVAMQDIVKDEATVEGSDCLIEGTPKDLASHFALRLACSQTTEMEAFLVEAETYLFGFRFSCLTESELVDTIKPLKRFHAALRQSETKDICCPQVAYIHRALDALTRKHDWSTLIHYYVTGSKCHQLVVPFECVLDLVAKRAVLVHRGQAYVPCRKLCDVMTSLFSSILKYGMTLAHRQLSLVLEDCRMKQLFASLKLQFTKNHRAFRGGGFRCIQPIRSEDIDELVETYPPCMAHLHRQLRRKHRLRHHSRVQYTLFLKELGLPVHEALQFWRHEYMLPVPQFLPTGKECPHNWLKDERKYTYSIRHLYGLEGSRTNYRAHCCAAIQNANLGPGEEGGCPFKDFDPERLRAQLDRDPVSASALEDIESLCRDQQCSQACALYLQARLNYITPATACGTRATEEHAKCTNSGVTTGDTSNIECEIGDTANKAVTAMPPTEMASLCEREATLNTGKTALCNFNDVQSKFCISPCSVVGNERCSKRKLTDLDDGVQVTSPNTNNDAACNKRRSHGSCTEVEAPERPHTNTDMCAWSESKCNSNARGVLASPCGGSGRRDVAGDHLCSAALTMQDRGQWSNDHQAVSVCVSSRDRHVTDTCPRHGRDASTDHWSAKKEDVPTSLRDVEHQHGDSHERHGGADHCKASLQMSRRAQPFILKPIDFHATYKELLKGMRHVQNGTETFS